MKNIFLSLIAGIFLCGCSTITVGVSNVTDYVSMDKPIQTGERFYTLNLSEFTPTNSSNSLIENELLEFIADDLNNKGFSRVSTIDSSDFIVTIYWTTTTEKTSGHNITYTVPSYETNTTTTTGTIGGSYISSRSSTTTYSTKDQTLYIPPVTSHPESFILSFLDTSKYKQRKTIERYRAESKFTSQQENPLTWAPEHIQNMLETFQKSIPEQTGYAGIGLNTEHSLPLIYHIDPAGPASKSNIPKGKKIIAINGEKIKYRTQAHKIIKKSKPGSNLILGVGKNNIIEQEVKIKTNKTPIYYQLEKPYF